MSPKPPDTLPPDFFSKPITVSPHPEIKAPDTLPSDFFSGGGGQQQPATTRDQLKSEGFLDSAWNALKSFPALVHSMATGDYQKAAQADRDTASQLQASGTPEQKREFAKDYLLRNIPFASSVYKAAQGNLGGAAGDIVGSLPYAAMPEAGRFQGAPPDVEVPLLPQITNPNPTEAAALGYLQSKGAPVPAGVQLGNPYVKGLTAGADATPLGSIVAQRAKTQTANVLRTEAGDLVNRALPKVPSSFHYGEVETAAADPANLRTIQTGTKQVPVLNVQGNPVPGQFRTLPVTESMPLPVQVGRLKPMLQPIYDLMQWMPAADRNASAGYTAIKNILDGPDYVPATQAEIGLGGLKSLARDGTGRSAGLAKLITPKLQDMIDNAVSVAGPNVVDAIQQARKSAAAEIGAGKLQTIFDKATAEGGFNREAGIWQDWQRARPAITKQLNPGVVADLDKFFLGAKKLAENVNPSGSTILGTGLASTGMVFTHPATGIPLVIAGGLLSKILRSEGGIKALASGIGVPLRGPGAVLAASRIAQVLQMNGVDMTQLPKAADATGPAPSGDLADQRPPLSSFHQQ
jgi:hypothetical protein